MPKRTLLVLSVVILSGASRAQISLPVPKDLTAVLAPTMGPLPVVALTWKAPEGDWAYRVYRSDGDSLAFRPLGMTKALSYYDHITTGPGAYYYKVRSFTLTADSQAVESDPSNTAWVTTGPLPRGIISGVVTDDSTGRPIPGVCIQFYRMSPSSNVTFALPFVVTDSLGQYKAEVDTGVCTIHAQPPPARGAGFPAYRAEWYDNVLEQSQATAVRVAEGKTFEANFGLSRQMTVCPKGAIAGKVTDEATQLPLPHAAVRFYPQGPHILLYPPPTAMADSLGEYRAVLDTGTYLVRAEGPPARTWYPAYWPEWFDNVREIADATPVPVLPGTNVEADFALAQVTPPVPVAIEGTVTNDVGNTDQVSRPLAGATVVIMRPIQAMTTLDQLSSGDGALDDGRMIDGLGYCRGVVWKGTTDSAGRYRGVVLSGSSYIAVAAKRGYLPEYYQEKTNPLQATLIKADGDVQGVDFTLAGNTLFRNSISGTVRDSLGTGVPSRIVLFPLRPAWPVWPGVRFGHTDSAGTFTLQDIQEGKYLVMAVPFRRYAPAFYKEGAYGVRCWEKADTVLVSGDVTGIDIGVVPILPRGALVIAGRVVDRADLPLDGVRVFAISFDGAMVGCTVTDNTGTFAVEGLASLPTTLAFDREGYEPGERAVTPGAGVFLFDAGEISLAASVTAIEVPPPLPVLCRMYPNYPNPFNPSTAIAFDVPAPSQVRIVVYNLLGQEIATLYNGAASAGTHTVRWEGRDRGGSVVAAGLYLVRFAARDLDGGGEYTQVGKVVFVK